MIDPVHQPDVLLTKKKAPERGPFFAAILIWIYILR